MLNETFRLLMHNGQTASSRARTLRALSKEFGGYVPYCIRFLSHSLKASKRPIVPALVRSKTMDARATRFLRLQKCWLLYH